MKSLTWNLEWAAPASKRLGLIQQIISEVDPDVACYTEVIRGVVSNGHAIEADSDYGYLNTGERLKVVLWSRTPWERADTIGDDELPAGRFVSGVTAGIRFVGVCIPWRDAHVKTGRKDREPWQDHLSYCKGLGRVLGHYSKSPEPLCVLGDFNQRIPRVNQPEHVANALLDAVSGTVTVVTEGIKDAEGHDLIDHIAVSSPLKAVLAAILPRFARDGTRLSDHVGVVAQLDNSNQVNEVDPSPSFSVEKNMLLLKLSRTSPC